ncbi:ECF transporter S component [Vagococcus coleopterorum]|uniref:Riboflavin transporter n=1 Tax=Vagococcus coleopterorum TaxID=2714946 RepID=A0A6G8ANQ3_9ENTE|nr:ECF transporter S component [Vagococcus coleopterorum]QIL46600.1 ECF transporter S component [Vagococcus coleopterorum]
MKKNQTKEMVGTAMLAAIAYILLLIAFPVIPAFPFMKVDFSEIAILISTYVFGPVAGILTALVRSLLHMLTSGEPAAFIGDAASFIAALSFVLPIYYLSKTKQTTKNLITSFVTGTVIMTVVMSVLNAVAIIPLYSKIAGFDIGMSVSKYVLYGVVPFNLVKGTLVSMVFMLIHQKVIPLISKQKKCK